MVGQFLKSTRELLHRGRNASFVVIDWRECLPVHPAHVVTWTPDDAHFNASRYAGYSPNDFRFALYAEFFAAHPQVKRAFIVDGRDTVLRENPLPLMQPRTLYVGTNPGGCGNRAVQAPPWCRDFITKCARGYLNAGLLGGDAAVLAPAVDAVLKLSLIHI